MLFLSIPLINENELLPGLIKCIEEQSYQEFVAYFCVNQPDEWWDDPQKAFICEENRKSLEMIHQINGFQKIVIDKSSKGKGWIGKKHGVGWARKTLMDTINLQADQKDIILSLDADTTFNKLYFSTVSDNFRQHPGTTGLAVPYYHLPVEDTNAYRAILRYEIYMRYYSVNLWRIGSPYSFTALGSAMACPVSAYRAIGGMTPKMSGEDFYFLQKLRKYGKLLFWNEEKVYPRARFSDRVYFGTGPAMIRGNAGDWGSYPVYPLRFFNEIHEFYQSLNGFYLKTNFNKVVEFLKMQFKEEDPFAPLRNNCNNEKQFIRSCHEKFDGLRILQYLKTRHGEEPSVDEKNLIDFFNLIYPVEFKALNINSDRFSFNLNDLEDFEKIRKLLVKIEEGYQINSVLS